MTVEGPVPDRQAIENAFRRLGDRLARRGAVADVHVFNGTAMTLVYDARHTTRDIDAIFQPFGAGQRVRGSSLQPSAVTSQTMDGIFTRRPHASTTTSQHP